MIRFEWDPAKATRNERKHGVGFEIALHVFEDPMLWSNRIESKAVNNDGRRWGSWEECCCCWWLTQCNSRMKTKWMK